MQDLLLRDSVVFGDSYAIAHQLPRESFQLIYMDPPFNTGKNQKRLTLSTKKSENGTRTGFGGNRYSSEVLKTQSYRDAYDDYLQFIDPILRRAYELLCEDGTLYFHIDYREAHYCKVLLDEIFGRDNFLNEIIWAYDYGGRSKKKWPAKHDTILVYVKDHDSYYFDQEAIDRIPYMAPGLVSSEKANRGKCPTDVWWHTIVPTNSREKTGYPTQKPLGILRRIIQASSRPKVGQVLDLFAGSGTTGAAAAELGRPYTLVDNNYEAILTMKGRLPANVVFLDSNLLKIEVGLAETIANQAHLDL